jgi:hypothetical protein
LGTSKFYEYISNVDDIRNIKKEVVDKFLNNFLNLLNDLSKKYINYSVHVISDSAIIVPKSNSLIDYKLPTYREFIKSIVELYASLINEQIPCRFILTRGNYFSVGLYCSKLNILPGGGAYLKCTKGDNIDLKGKGPGIYSDIPEVVNKNDNSAIFKLIDLVEFKNYLGDINKLNNNLQTIKSNDKSDDLNNIESKYLIINNWINN